MDLKVCSKCGVVVDNNKVEQKNVYKIVDDFGQNADGFKCPVCSCINLESDGYFFNREEGTEEIKRQIGGNFTLNGQKN
jgi:rubredoxin